jgi:hypothetical protein
MHLLGRAFLAGIVSLLALGTSPARAALYTGAWDPPFGTLLFTGLSPGGWNLDWSGTYTVDADCPDVGSGTLATCTPPVASVVSAAVTLSRPGFGSTTINFLPSSFVIEDLFYQNDVITKLKTDLSGFLAAPASGDSALDTALAGWIFALNFVINGQAATGGDLPPIVTPPLPATYSGPVLYASKSFGPGVALVARSDVTTYPPEFRGLFRVRDVPEPGTVVLLAGALLAVGFLRARVSGARPR